MATRSPVKRFIKNLGQHAGWLLALVLAPFSTRRFVVLTPPCVARQVVGDQRTRGVFSLIYRPAQDYQTFKEVFVREDYKLPTTPHTTALLQHYHALVAAGQTPLIVDAGANVGLASVYFKRLFPAAKMVLIEPDAANAAIASANNPGALLIPAGLAGTPGHAQLTNPGRGPNALRTARSAQGPLPLTTLPEVLARPELAGAVPFIIKIDIEGAEADVFSGPTDWLKDVPLLVVELHDWLLPGAGTSAPVLQALAASGRDFLHSRENIFSFAGHLGGNM